MHILLTTGPFIERGEYKISIAEIGVGGVKKYLFRAVLGSDRPNPELIRYKPNRMLGKTWVPPKRFGR